MAAERTVIIIRCNDIASDPRAMKYVRFLQQKGIEYKLIGWNRDARNNDLPNSIMWRRQAGFNVGGLKAVKNRIGWMKFVYSTLKSLSIPNAVIHGCDLDSAFPAACYKLFHKSNKLIFDVFDWFSATLYKQKSYILFAFKIMEKYTVKHSDHIILCEPERVEQIPFEFDQTKLSILPNIPYFSEMSFLNKSDKYTFDNNLLTFSYVGGFTKERCLLEIISLAEKGEINLSIAGFGNEEIVKKLEKDKNCANIKYYGKVAYEEGLNISYNSDVIYAMYSTINPNHVYAAPNKYYEAMFLGKPLFSTEGTIVEQKIVKNDMGFISGESEENILRVIHSISSDSVIEKGKNANNIWQSTFGDFTKNFLENDYWEMLK